MSLEDVFKPSRFADVKTLMDADESRPLEDDDFDTELWKLLCDRVESLDSLKEWPPEVIAYYASRLMEWEVGNGGFAQAAYNIPDWFAPAAEGYEMLDLPAAAERIRVAQELALGDREKFSFLRRRQARIHKVFQAFEESRLNELNGGLDALGWWATDTRLAFVRRNRPAFRRIV
jgi:hypothetical protein